MATNGSSICVITANANNNLWPSYYRAIHRSNGPNFEKSVTERIFLQRTFPLFTLLSSFTFYFERLSGRLTFIWTFELHELHVS